MKYLSAFFAATFVFASPVSGHHSDVALDLNSVVTFEGTVTEFSLRNPHTYFTVATTNESGAQVEWTVQMASAITEPRLSLGRGSSIGRGASCEGRTSVWNARVDREGRRNPSDIFDRLTFQATSESRPSPQCIYDRGPMDSGSIKSGQLSWRLGSTHD